MGFRYIPPQLCDFDTEEEYEEALDYYEEASDLYAEEFFERNH